MYVKQVSVFLENSTGTLARVTKLLGENGLDIIAMSIADTENYGILRIIVSDTDRCVELLKGAGYAVKLTDVVAVAVNDRPGGLHPALEALAEENIALKYVYSFVRTSGNRAILIFRVSDGDAAIRLLKAHGVQILTDAEVHGV